MELNKNPTQEQIKEFWEKCGLNIGDDNGQLYINDGRHYDGIDLDLNSLFNYAVPKAIIHLMGHKTYDRISAIRYLFRKWLEGYVQSGCVNFALALFWAIRKLFDYEKNTT